MQDCQLYEQILGIVAPWSVERVELNLAGGEVHVHLEHSEHAKWLCPECSKTCTLQDHGPSRTWRYLGVQPVNERAEFFVIDSGHQRFQSGNR